MYWTIIDLEEANRLRCERCSRIMVEGDWPWCKNGDPKEHER